MKKQTKEEPDHSKWNYQPRHIDQWGAIKSCICKACKAKRKESK